MEQTEYLQNKLVGNAEKAFCNERQVRLDDAWPYKRGYLTGYAAASTWVPCSERWPENTERVLYSFDGRIELITHQDCDISRLSNEGATHWLPLPIAPKS